MLSWKNNYKTKNILPLIKMLNTELITNVYKEVNSAENKGKKASYIPELAKVDAHKLGMYISATQQSIF